MAGPIHEFTQLPGGGPAAAARESASGPALRGSVERAAGEPLVGLIYNPRSHRNRGADLGGFDRPGVLQARPDSREEIAGALGRLADAGIDMLVINGGDGTVRDVLTAAQPFFGEDWPAIAVLPKGKTNALNIDLGAPRDWTLDDAIAAWKAGRRARRRPLAFTASDAQLSAVPMLGFILGAGAIAQGVKTGQSAHALGAFNSFAVGLAGFWGVVTSLLGSDDNPWRRGAAMDIVLGPGGERLGVDHAHQQAPRRFLLLSTTLERLPMGIRPFGPHSTTGGEGIKLAVLDRPRRWLVGLFPAIALGWAPGWLERAGYHQRVAEAFDLDIDAQFIVDGEIFPAGRYRVAQGPALDFVVP